MKREEVEGLVGELREALSKAGHEQFMKSWDQARTLLLDGITGSLPRDVIESALEDFFEPMEKAASALEALLQEQDRGLSREPSPSTEKATPKSAATEAERVESSLPPHEEFTVVFAGSLRRFQGNPFKTDTPFGRPVAVGIGNAFEQLEELADAPLSSPSGEGWKPIETAPKDGTDFWAYPDLGKHFQARIIEDGRCHNLSSNRWANPTHWQPLPPPPANPDPSSRAEGAAGKTGQEL